ncbi:MAG: hypothetical protein LRZ93_05940, partial [Clostridiales bacterium]|nr:hypothetical protein [Clostridiales bacterium]
MLYAKKKSCQKKQHVYYIFVILMTSVAIFAVLKITEEWVTPVLDNTMDQDEDIQDWKFKRQRVNQPSQVTPMKRARLSELKKSKQ